MACFSRRARLLKPEEFKRVFESGRRCSVKLLTAIVFDGVAPQNHPRLGLAIAKKSIPLSTTRNRVKRCVRESFRAHQGHLPAVDIVILSRPGTLAAPSAALHDNLDLLWKRVAESCAA